MKEGLKVSVGDVLGQLDPADLPFHIKEDEANLEGLKTQLDGKLPSEMHLEGLKKVLADSEKLYADGYMHKDDYDKLVTEVNETGSQAEEDRAGLITKQKVLLNDIDDTKDQIHRLDIVAPYNGTVTEVYAYPGDLLTKGKFVAKLISTDLKVTGEVNQDDVASVKEGANADIRFFAYRDTYPARVKLVLPSSDPTTQRFSVLLELLNAPDNLMAGLTGEVLFKAGEHDHTLLIPRRALLGKTTVVVVQGDHVEVRDIKPGYLNLTEAEVLSGLNEGDQVLTDNLDLFRNGDRVRLTPSTDDQPAAAAPPQN
jgi:RND family efflux transporter MFP subunit